MLYFDKSREQRIQSLENSNTQFSSMIGFSVDKKHGDLLRQDHIVLYFMYSC